MEPCCSVGYGGPFTIPDSLGKGCAHPWHISWLPKGYAPSGEDYTICVVAEPPGEDWSDFGLRKGKRPPLIEAICEAVERHMASGAAGSVEQDAGREDRSARG